MMGKRSFHELLRLQAKPVKDHVTYLERKYDSNVEKQANLDAKEHKWDGRYTEKKNKAQDDKERRRKENKKRKAAKQLEVSEKALTVREAKEDHMLSHSTKKQGSAETAELSKLNHLHQISEKTKTTTHCTDALVKSHKAADSAYAHNSIEELISKLHCFSPTSVALPVITAPKPSAALSPRPPVRPKGSPGRGYLTCEAVSAATRWISYKQAEENAIR
eukprot:TRINITY_DN31204_c0_g1_i1.p1 TRINITY_DN31204_c0_g1~~TRINITY_DN31204_c0_g1_i1.p1  ORF type:complete len:219 (+),score=38.16 TRINITY_DN31204_c0_g1_i1:54-710(+)